jgi:nucleoside-diphosphate-sugar epimerase
MQRQGFADEAELEEVMTRPTPALSADLARAQGDIMVLGAGGKMGPTLARLARRADPARRVIAVARFSDPAVRATLQEAGVECLACDLLDRDAVARLPDVPNIVYMAGRKFGSGGSEDLTWAMNALAPAIVAERFARSRIVAFSTGCVYPYVDVRHQGATEATSLRPPPGEYAASCIGRERMFQYGSRVHGTAGRLIRLNYAIDMRYGVLHDVARRVLAGTPIRLETGHVNVIWQGDANAQVLRALAHCTTPTSALNVSGPEVISIRALALAFGRRFDREPEFDGTEAPTAWLINTAEATRLFGYPAVPLARMIDWTAQWLLAGGRSWEKGTGYDIRSGEF